MKEPRDAAKARPAFIAMRFAPRERPVKLMLTLADVRPGWPGLFKIITQKGFDPVVLTLESAAKGYMFDCIPKHAFKDIVCRYLMLANIDDVFVTGFCENLVSFIMDTSYCDKLLVKYRITSESHFSAFAYDCLSSWSQTSACRYENHYLPAVARKSPFCSSAYEQRINFLESAIIEKTKSLLGKDRGNR